MCSWFLCSDFIEKQGRHFWGFFSVALPLKDSDKAWSRLKLLTLGVGDSLLLPLFSYGVNGSKRRFCYAGEIYEFRPHTVAFLSSHHVRKQHRTNNEPQNRIKWPWNDPSTQKKQKKVQVYVSTIYFYVSDAYISTF